MNKVYIVLCVLCSVFFISTITIGVLCIIYERATEGIVILVSAVGILLLAIGFVMFSWAYGIKDIENTIGKFVIEISGRVRINGSGKFCILVLHKRGFFIATDGRIHKLYLYNNAHIKYSTGSKLVFDIDDDEFQFLSNKPINIQILKSMINS